MNILIVATIDAMHRADIKTANIRFSQKIEFTGLKPDIKFTYAANIVIAITKNIYPAKTFMAFIFDSISE